MDTNRENGFKFYIFIYERKLIYMARENVVNLGREFSVTLNVEEGGEGEKYMTWEFEANIDDPLKRTNLLIAMWDAVEEAFRNSGLIRLEERSGEIHRTCDIGRSTARIHRESRFYCRVCLCEYWPGRRRHDPTDPSFEISLDFKPMNTHPTCWCFEAKLPASGFCHRSED